MLLHTWYPLPQQPLQESKLRAGRHEVRRDGRLDPRGSSLRKDPLTIFPHPVASVVEELCKRASMPGSRARRKRHKQRASRRASASPCSTSGQDTTKPEQEGTQIRRASEGQRDLYRSLQPNAGPSAQLEVSSMPPHSQHLPRSPKTHSISAGYVLPWEGQEKAVRTNRSSDPSEGRGVEVQRLCLSLLRSLPIFRPQVPGALIGGPLHTPLPLFILLLVTPPPLQAMSDACSLPNSRNVESVSLRDIPD
jgi:hypothetical protein